MPKQKTGDHSMHDSQGGFLNGISVPSFLQLIEAERKTCLLAVQSEDKGKGLFYFNKGVLYDADCGDLGGEDAAIEMITWDTVRISFQHLPEKGVKKRINKGLMGLIMEGMRLKDEAGAAEKGGGGWDEKIALETELEGFGQKEDDDKLAESEEQTISIEGGEKMAGVKDVLKKMAEEMDGLMVVGVMGMDGIPVAQHNPGGANVDALGSKFAMVMKLVQKSVNDLKGMGDFEENLVQSKNSWVLSRFVSKDYYLCVAIGREGTLGNVRMVAQKYTEKLQEAL